MPPRSQVTTLPPHIRKQIERRLFENGFRDYDGLAQWVRGEGYNISDDSLWRYGRTLQQEMHAARVSALQAAALADLPDASAAIAQTLIIIAQQKALAALLDEDEIKPAALNALSRLLTAALASSAAVRGKVSSASPSVPPAANKPGSAAQASRSAQLVSGSGPLTSGSAELNPARPTSPHLAAPRPAIVSHCDIGPFAVPKMLLTLRTRLSAIPKRTFSHLPFRTHRPATSRALHYHFLPAALKRHFGWRFQTAPR